MVGRPTSEKADLIGVISFIAFAVSVFSVVHCAQFLYQSSIFYIDKSLFVFQCISMSSFLITAVLKDVSMPVSPFKKYLIITILPTILCTIEFFYGFEYAFDSMNYFYSIEKKWYDPVNLKVIQKIQKKLRCCDFQASIIDAVNECHHGFSQPCISSFVKNSSTSVVISGLSLIGEGIAHLSIIYLCVEMCLLTRGASSVSVSPMDKAESLLPKFGYI